MRALIRNAALWLACRLAMWVALHDIRMLGRDYAAGRISMIEYQAAVTRAYNLLHKVNR